MSKIIKPNEVPSKTGISRSQWYKLLSQGDFPEPIKLSPRRIGFLESDLDGWIESRRQGLTWSDYQTMAVVQ